MLMIGALLNQLADTCDIFAGDLYFLNEAQCFSQTEAGVEGKNLLMNETHSFINTFALGLAFNTYPDCQPVSVFT